MAVPHWETDPDSWDSIEISTPTTYAWAGTRVEIDGDLEYKWDVKEAPGTDGATETPRGYSPAEVTVTIGLYSEGDFVEWQKLLKDIRPRAGKKLPVAIDVDHPQLALHELRRFHVKGIPFLKRDSDGSRSGVLKLFEWFAQPKASPKPKKKDIESIDVPVAAGLRPATTATPPSKSPTTGRP